MRFLIVDDDPEVVDFVVSTVKKLEEKSEILTAFTGIDAWKKINEFVPDLVVLDLKLPGMYGTNICAKLRKSEVGKNMKIFVLTSYLTMGVRQRVMEAGADGCMQKPFNPEELLSNLKKVLISHKGSLSPGDLG